MNSPMSRQMPAAVFAVAIALLAPNAIAEEAPPSQPSLVAEICFTDPALKNVVGSGVNNELGFACASTGDAFITIPELYQRGYRVVQIWEQAAHVQLRGPGPYTAWAILVERQR